MTDRAILFDLDGTLLDTIDDLTDAVNEAIRSFDAPAISVTRCKEIIGAGIGPLMTRALPPELGEDEAVVAEAIQRMRLAYSRLWDRSCRLFPGIADLLDALAARHVPMAVLSNKPNGFTVQMVDHFLSAWPLRPVVGAFEDRPRKPDPTLALEIAAEIGAPPERCLMVGDSDVDMLVGRNAGMTSVGVAWGFRPISELEESGSHAVIRRPERLLELLEVEDDR